MIFCQFCQFFEIYSILAQNWTDLFVKKIGFFDTQTIPEAVKVVEWGKWEPYLTQWYVIKIKQGASSKKLL